MARVALVRSEWGRSERLPPCCVYCGRAADGYTVRTLRCETGGFEGAGPAPSGEAAAVGAAFGIVKWLTVGNDPVRVTRLQVHLPVCARHRRAWLIWSWFRMSLDHEALVLSGVAPAFAQAVEEWRVRTGGRSASIGLADAETF
jgi:hypothetical protein